VTCAIFVAALLATAAPGPQRDASAAAAGLKSADPIARTHAACDLRELGSAAAGSIPALVSLLDDASPVDSSICGERTWRWKGHDATTTPGEQAASALVAIGTPAYEPLTRAAQAQTWIARENAIWALGALGERKAVPVVRAALRDNEAAVRRRGAWALGALDASEAVAALVGALSDEDPGVRRQAAWALGAIGDHAAVDGLLKALTDSAPEVREQAAWALGAIGDSKATSGLTKALKDTDARVRRQAAWALGTIGGN
jgi:HEAT repeat protein